LGETLDDGVNANVAGTVGTEGTAGEVVVVPSVGVVVCVLVPVESTVVCDVPLCALVCIEGRAELTLNPN
jgi:hypothetical protein